MHAINCLSNKLLSEHEFYDLAFLKNVKNQEDFDLMIKDRELKIKDFNYYLMKIRQVKIWAQKIERNKSPRYKPPPMEQIIDKINKNESIEKETKKNIDVVKKAIEQIGTKKFDKYLDNIEQIEIKSDEDFEQNRETFLYKYIDNINKLNNTNIQIDDILKVLYDDILFRNKNKKFLDIEKRYEKRNEQFKKKFEEHFSYYFKNSEFENKFNEYMKEQDNLWEGLKKGDKNIIEILKRKIYQKEFFILFQEFQYNDSSIMHFRDFLEISDDKNGKYYLNKLGVPWSYGRTSSIFRSSINELKFNGNSLFYQTCFYLSCDSNILNKIEKYVKYYKGKNCHDPGLEYKQINSMVIKNKIEFLLKEIKNNFPSGWKIISKNDYFRIEPFGDKLKEIQLPCGKSTIYIDGIFKKIEDVIQAKNINNEILKINNKGKVTQDNLKEVYEDCFKMIINRIITNKLIGENDKGNKNQELIKFINKLENETEGFANKNSKKISQFLLDLNQNKKIRTLNQSNLKELTELGLEKLKDEIDCLVQEELKMRKEKINPDFILLLDTSENMNEYAENFVKNIIYQCLLKLNFVEKNEVKIYTFNSVDVDKSVISVKKTKKFSCDCEGEINFTEAFKQVIEDISQINNMNYYLLIVLSGNIKDKDLIRSIAFKLIGLSSKVFIKSRVVKFITEKSKFDEDEITFGLLQQISTGDLKIYKPIEIKPNESKETQINKILNSFI